MEKMPCATCRAPSILHCGLCNDAVCKPCAHALGTTFSYLPNPPEFLTKGLYCPTCFVTKIADEQAAYERTMEAARNIDVYYKTQGKETRFIRREAPPYVLTEATDREEIMLHLAFLAAHAGYTTLVDVEVIGEKRREGAYQTTIYRGTGTPANARTHQIPKDKSIRSNPN